jgi:hypothetical protein
MSPLYFNQPTNYFKYSTDYNAVIVFPDIPDIKGYISRVCSLHMASRCHKTNFEATVATYPGATLRDSYNWGAVCSDALNDGMGKYEQNTETGTET